MLRPFRPDDRGVVRRWIDDPVIGEDLVMYAMTRDDYERVKDGWTSTG
jgi:hypothetical protein